MASYAYYCLHKFNMLPSQFLALDQKEQAFIIAAIDIKAEERKKELEAVKSQTNKR